MRTPAKQEIGAAQFKAECLGLLNEVKTRGTRFIVTKHGQPFAELRPVERPRTNPKEPLDFLYIGGGMVVGDLDEPAVPIENWDALK